MSNGVILYEGPSKLDGKPIVAIATGLVNKSSNRKTGDMIQTFIIRSDIEPHLGLKTGDDASVCGDCKHRPISGGACYVQVAWAPLQVYKAYKKGSYPKVDSLTIPDLSKDRGVRLGSYGDPAAVPIKIWTSLVSKSSFHTGYTHQWKKCDPKFKEIVMASADTAQEAEEAKKKGYRYFRVTKDSNVKLKGELVCPASEEKNKILTCEQCKACSGTNSGRISNVVIRIHGVTKNRFKE